MENHMPGNEKDIEQHSLLKSVILHLLPGILIFLFFIILTPILTEKGFPTLFCLFLAVMLVLIPFELGYILYQAKKKNKTLSLVRYCSLQADNSTMAACCHNSLISRLGISFLFFYFTSNTGSFKGRVFFLATGLVFP